MNTARTVLKNTSVLFIAELMSKAISIAYVAVLARYIHVDGMGEISTAQALSSTMIVLVSFGFSQLVVREIAARPNKSASIVSNVALLRLTLALAYSVFVVLAVQNAHYSPELATIVYLYAINAVLGAFVDIGWSVFQAFEQMQYILVLGLFRDGLNVALSLLAIYLHYSLVVIVAISVLASALQLTFAYILVRKKFAIRYFEFNLTESKKLLIAAIPFAAIPLYYLATYSLNTLILSVHRSIAEVGAFGAASNLTTILMIIPTVFMRAAFPVFARLSGTSRSSLREAYSRSFNYLLIIGLAVSVGTFVTGAAVMRLVYGSGFEQAVPAIRILAWVPLFSFVGHVNGNLLVATGREKLFMVFEGVFAFLTVALSFILTLRYGYLGSCVAILAPIMVSFVFYSLFCHRMIGVPLPLKTAAFATLAGAVMAACTYTALQKQVNLFAVILVVGPAAYFVALYLLRVLSNEDIALLRQALRPKLREG